jgi:predicted enzyme related to lactoylglutathione lyase
MSSGVKIFIFPVKDLDRAKDFYGALLGTNPDVDSPYYVQFVSGDQRIGLDPNGHVRGFPGSVGYWEVDDVNVRFSQLIAAGATEHEAPRNVGNGALIASVIDTDGNVIGLIEPS